MSDPLEAGDEATRALFAEIGRLVVGRPQHVVWGTGLNLLVNSIRQCTAKRKDAEALFDQLMGKAKTVLLDVHYDSVTGLRRGVFPYTQVIQPPFHQNESVIFHGK